MSRFIVLLQLLLLFVSLQAQQFEQRPSWREEFNYKGRVDSRYWNYHIGKFEKEQEYYTDSIGNVYVKKGKLHITATKNLRQDKICSSGRIHTLKKKSFLYGKLEIKARVPTGKGIFPAIWMLREDHPRVFPLGEIDIMEYIDCYEGKKYSATTHIVEKEPGRKELRHPHTTVVAANMKKYHIYTLEWTPERLVFKLDKKKVYEFNKEEAEYWPFADPYYLILNVAYGSWGGSCGMDENIFPREMIVDWIRYYKLKQ